MVKAGIGGSDDVQVGIALITPEGTPNIVSVYPIPRDLEKLHETLAKVSALEASERVMPLGIAVWLRDHEVEAPNNVSTWVQPWLTGARAKKAANEAQRAFEKSGGHEVIATF